MLQVAVKGVKHLVVTHRCKAGLLGQKAVYSDHHGWAVHISSRNNLKLFSHQQIYGLEAALPHAQPMGNN